MEGFQGFMLVVILAGLCTVGTTFSTDRKGWIVVNVIFAPSALTAATVCWLYPPGTLQRGALFVLRCPSQTDPTQLFIIFFIKWSAHFRLYIVITKTKFRHMEVRFKWFLKTLIPVPSNGTLFLYVFYFPGLGDVKFGEYNLHYHKPLQVTFADAIKYSFRAPPLPKVAETLNGTFYKKTLDMDLFYVLQNVLLNPVF